MSRVFVAEELPFGRQVVVKVLPEDLAGTVSIERFRREISLLARLQHPHIIPMISAGEIDGLPYYTMPFVQGESLRARLEHGELGIQNAVAILRDVAKGLAHAHQKGVAHRDIKPDNVLLAGTSAVISDFGVAKAVTDAAVSGALTSVGIALGTPAYMAPEQAAADPSTDLRADIYAFGAMAYEMVAGHPPFSGRSFQATLAAHATELPVPITVARTATPPELADLIMRCLEKRPGDRPQSADELVTAMENIGSSAGSAHVRQPGNTVAQQNHMRSIYGIVAALTLVALGAFLWTRYSNSAGQSAPIRSIAVLPFENTSRDTMFNYLEDGITDHVRDALNVMPELEVRARSSSQRMKGREAAEIGKTLGVAAVLQGTISRSGSRLHVTAELVRTSDNSALWSRTFDGSAAELGGIQDTIARAVAVKIGRPLIDGGTTVSVAASDRGTRDIDAYDHFLKGKYAYDRLQFEKAIELFREAIAYDPQFARAHAFLAMSYANAGILSDNSTAALNALARSSAKAALALDSTVAEAYAAQGFALINETRIGEAVRPIARAAALAPRDAGRLSDYGLTLSQVGRVDEALVYAQRARNSDPLSSAAAGILAYILRLAGRYDEAVEMARVGRALDPSNQLILEALGYALVFSRAPDSAVATFEAAMRMDPGAFGVRTNLVFAYAAAGRWKDAELLRRTLELNGGASLSYYERTILHLAFGETGAAMASLQRAVDKREGGMIGIKSLACDPVFSPLRADSRFPTLMRQLGSHSCSGTTPWPIGHRVSPRKPTT